ncbi:P63C domain-containing protein [Roseomonas gilardii]|uniref:P63C domain-containing protein n=1 Tax=Roseomonas gilardii TaxID=257708 RepID=UPI000952655A|nr:P63C domain-containing protein [Roseomonas gilardii]
MDDNARKKGGENRARFLSPEDRAAIARAGAQARLLKADPSRASLPRAVCGADDQPLIIGDVAVPAYVLEDERRIIALVGILDAAGIARGGSMIKGMNRLELFVTRARIRPFVTDEVFEKVRSPIVFLTPQGTRAYGYETDVLIDICEAVVAAAAAQVLQPQQRNIARQCNMLLRGLTRVGLAALVDEATGYQKVRQRDGLRKILEAFVAKELLPWTKRFPDTYYEEIYRLWGWKRDWSDRKHPGYLGHLTNQLVYDRLPDGVNAELKVRNPVNEETGRRRWKNHQFLTPDLGHPVLSAHMAQVVALLKVARSKDDFWGMFRRLFPDAQGELDIDGAPKEA